MSAKDNEPPSLRAGTFFVNTVHHVTHTIPKLGRTFQRTDDLDGMCLSDTSVVALPAGDDTLLYRAVAFAEEGRCNLYALEPHVEETLIQRAVDNTPHLKLSWTRWVGMTKSKQYPADATDAERAVFGPHCLIGAGLLDKRASQKRARDAASRRKRAAAVASDPSGEHAPPAPKRVTLAPEEPPCAPDKDKVIKLEPEPAQEHHEPSDQDTPNGKIQLTLTLPTVSQKMVQAALAGMAAAMT